MQLRTLSALATAVALWACTPQHPPQFAEADPISVPAAPGSFAPRLAGRDPLLLSWITRDGDTDELLFAEYTGNGWGSPASVIKHNEMFANWADLPAVTPEANGTLLAHWLQYSADEKYSYDVVLARSADNGETWSEPLRPHDDGTPTEHGFVSLYPTAAGTGLVWLDGRNMVIESENPAENGMTLRNAVLTTGGDIESEAILDGLVCECCQTGVATASAGAVAVYRNRTENEIRDIYVARQVEGAWQPGVAIHNDSWEIEGCPVNGPSIDAAGDLVVVAWFSAANNRPIVRAIVSTNGGKTFGKPVVVTDRRAMGRVGVAIIDRHTFAVSWLAKGVDSGYEVNLRGFTADGQSGPEWNLGLTDEPRTFPQLVRVDDKLIMSWTDIIGGESRIMSVAMPILGFYD